MSDDYEKALLGAILHGYKGFPDLMRVVQGRDFNQPHHEEIWEAASRVYSSGGTVEPLTVRTSLGEIVLKLPGGPLYLHELMTACQNFLSAPHYADKVADAAGRRRIREAATYIHQLSEEPRELDEIAEDARQRLDQAVLDQSRKQAGRVGDMLPEVLDIAEHGAARGMASPWSDLDELTRGMKPGRLVVIGARPGVGKSLMGANLASHVASRHGKTA